MIGGNFYRADGTEAGTNEYRFAKTLGNDMEHMVGYSFRWNNAAGGERYTGGWQLCITLDGTVNEYTSCYIFGRDMSGISKYWTTPIRASSGSASTTLPVIFLSNYPSFMVTYDASGGSGAPSAQIWNGNASSHEFTIPMQKPTRNGYEFMYWALSNTDPELAYYPGETIDVSSPTTLIAKWKNIMNLTLPDDVLPFTNKYTFFCAKNYDTLSQEEKNKYKYDISFSDYARLISIAGPSQISSRPILSIVGSVGLNILKLSPWAGSCFGMSALTVLVANGLVDPTKYGYNTIHKMDIEMNTNGDFDVGRVESLVNYYHLTQAIGSIFTTKSLFNPFSESSNLHTLINKLKETNRNPVLLNLSFTDGSGHHSVVAYRLVEHAPQTYTIFIYDCSLNTQKPYTLTIKKDSSGYKKECIEWENGWENKGIFIESTITAKDFQNVPFLIQSMDSTDFPAEYSMTTSFDSFTVSDGTASVTVRDGAVDAENALGLVFYGNESEPGFTPSYRTSLPALTGGTYTVEPLTNTDGDQPDKYTIQFRYDDALAGFFHNLVSAAPVTVRLGAGGALMTQSEAVAAQTLTSAYNGSRIAADGVTVSGQTTGFTASMQDGSVSVASQTAAEIDLTLSSGLKEQTKTLTLDENGVTLGALESDERTCEIRRGEEALDTVHLGCAVAFDSCGGSTVATAAAAYGSRITEPEAPVRDGYLFHGWYTDPDCTKPWSFTSAVKEDMVLYAEWWVDPECWRTITFRADGVDDLVLQVRKDTRLTSADLPASDCMPGMTITWDAQQVADLLKAPVTKDVVISGTAVPCAILSIASAGYQDGTVTALVKNTGKAQTLTFIAAAYDADGRMTDCRTAPVTVEANAEASVSLPFPANPETIIRCYLTDSRSAPVCPRVELRSSET